MQNLKNLKNSKTTKFYKFLIKTEFINSTIGDCFVASLLAMTMDRQLLRFALQKLAMTVEANLQKK
ncbi:hypothetical protein OFO27_00215 [Campylobacter sp. CS_ED1]|uniref:hypothetical protein n=1 Tax=Campylobacter sp. CS_ED1 TaxID=2984140 RepID=UPI0022E9A4CF|nr:hypothetical protein [Campylobacter sp. CS_ED1]MDA3084955.1 hypothetical protein [Campylobacter sp. CS_ED1]